MAGIYLDANGLAHLSLLIKQAITDAVNDLKLEMPKVKYGTKAEWDAAYQTIAQENTIYIYTDYLNYDGKEVAGIKVGDGTSFLIDMPFLDQVYSDHIHDTTVHITQQERDFWNNKVRCYIETEDNVELEELIFTTH